jgi:hypothetical protein
MDQPALEAVHANGFPQPAVATPKHPRIERPARQKL